MAIEWFYTTNKQQMGPVSWAELRVLADSGILKPNDMVWSEGMDEWVKAIRQNGLFTDGAGSADNDSPRRRSAYSESKPPPGRRSSRDDDDDDEEDEREARRSARRRAEERAGMSPGLKVVLILGGVFVVLIALAGCGGLLIWFAFSARGGAAPVRESYTVNNLRAHNIDERRFTFTANRRVIITSTNNIQFPNTDVDLHILRGNDGPVNEFPFIADVRLPMEDRNCRVEFVVPETGTYRVRIVNLGPGMANSCNVQIEER